MTSRIDARPALKRKNLTPASRDTNRSVTTMPTPRCARKRKRTVESDTVGRASRAGQAGRAGYEQAARCSPPGPPGLPGQPASAKPLVDFVPVDDVPPRVDVVRAAVLVFQVVGVLPDVEAEDRLLPVHHRVVLVRRALDRDLPAVVHDPRPAAAEPADRRLLEFFLELVEAAERGVDRVGDRAGRCAPRFRPHDLPEHRVVHVAAAVVADRGAYGLRHAVDAANQIF